MIRRTEPAEQSGVQLFHLGRDPKEQHDLAVEERGLRNEMERSLETMEAGLASGVYLELVNGTDPSSHHVFTGSILANGTAVFDKVDMSTGASPQQAVLSPDRRRIDFKVELPNRPNPVRQDPAVLIDVARIRVEMSEAVAFRTELSLDGAALGGGALVLGDAAVPGPAGLSEMSARDPRLRLATGGTAVMMQPAASERPRARLYALPTVTALEAPMDPAVAERLRALGYIR